MKAKIPSTGEELHRIGLGTYRAFDVSASEVAQTELLKVMSRFLALGSTLIDSSPMYGKAEAAVGEVSRKLDVNSKLFMATKVWTSGKEQGIAQMNQSISKMGRTKIDLMQIHNLVDWAVHLKTLRSWKEEGRIRYIGITHYSTGAYGQIEQILKKEPMDFLQIPYSISERTAEKTLIPLAAEKGVAIIANEPFAQGALFRRVGARKLPAFASEFGIDSWSQYFLKFILSRSDVQFMIPATASLSHLEDNMRAAEGRLPDAKQRDQMARELAS